MKGIFVLYLASPYSHREAETRQYRYLRACRATAKLMAAGIPVFSPLCNSVPAVELGGLVTDHAGFLAIDLPILRRCDEILVVALDGWTVSSGLRQEMFEALAWCKPITLIGDADIERLPAIPKHARRFLTSSIFTEVYETND